LNVYFCDVGPDGHLSQYELSWLERTKAPIQKNHDLKLWGCNLEKQIPKTFYKDIIHGHGMTQWLTHLNEYGIGFVDGVPPTLEVHFNNKQASEQLSTKLSFIRPTHYGGFWDFSADMEHGDTAYTNIALPAHTDTTYFTDPVGLQFFHLLEHRGSGGESLYVDGFHVATQLKKEQPWAFDALCRIELSAHSAGDDNTSIQPSKPFTILELNKQGRLHQIRYNNDDRSTLCLTNPETQEFYAALHEWTRLVRKKENEFWIKLQPGLAVMMDNWRILHGRASFTGYRRMCGSYHNRDDYQSRVKTTIKANNIYPMI
jgi:trimethyllysine dioxygenase